MSTPPSQQAPVPSPLLTSILDAVGDEIANISTLNTKLDALAQLGASLVALETLIAQLPPVAVINSALTACSSTVSDILAEKQPLGSLGQSLSSLYVVQADIGAPPSVWTPQVLSATLQATSFRSPSKAYGCTLSAVTLLRPSMHCTTLLSKPPPT